VGFAPFLEVAHRHFHDPESLAVRDHRQEAIHVAVHRHLVQDLAPEGAEIAVQVVEIHADDLPDHPVEAG